MTNNSPSFLLHSTGFPCSGVALSVDSHKHRQTKWPDKPRTLYSPKQKAKLVLPGLEGDPVKAWSWFLSLEGGVEPLKPDSWFVSMSRPDEVTKLFRDSSKPWLGIRSQQKIFSFPLLFVSCTPNFWFLANMHQSSVVCFPPALLCCLFFRQSLAV